MDPYVREFLPDHEVLFDQSITLIPGLLVPVGMLSTRIDKMIFTASRDDVLPALRISQPVIGNKRHFLCHGQIVLGSFKIAAQARSKQLRRHVLDRVERLADPPQHNVRLRIKTDERVAVQQKVILKRIVNRKKLPLKSALAFAVEFSP